MRAKISHQTAWQRDLLASGTVEALAEQEARAILAETEPEGLYLQLQARPDLRHQEFLGPAQDALADALAAFVAEERSSGHADQ